MAEANLKGGSPHNQGAKTIGTIDGEMMPCLEGIDRHEEQALEALGVGMLFVLFAMPDQITKLTQDLLRVKKISRTTKHE
ncbi:hypothetical protein H5410_031335 [Solanum commersonii]|uniref:Uncharacterized protein n=1 Tax=Solanum commersonii TaxID=4109 RepID=A0A9J5YIV4_SOLCO|nr:hypothetical protein H5410_031335 [Solanum commersonii]